MWQLVVRKPNRRECYGKFGHEFVNFPEHYFPTRGELGAQTLATHDSIFPEYLSSGGATLNLIILAGTSDSIQTWVSGIILILI